MSNEKLKKVIKQASVVENLAKIQKSNPDTATGLRLEKEIDRLAYLNAAAKRNAAERAKFVIQSVRAAMLGRAITQPLPPLKK